MIEKSCRCGQIKKNFRIDIGPFFIGECCIEAGYNHLGKKLEAKDLGLTEDQVKSALESGESLEIKDDPSLDAEPEVEEVKPEKPKRKYNRNGNIKKEE